MNWLKAINMRVWDLTGVSHCNCISPLVEYLVYVRSLLLFSHKTLTNSPVVSTAAQQQPYWVSWKIPALCPAIHSGRCLREDIATGQRLEFASSTLQATNSLQFKDFLIVDWLRWWWWWWWLLFWVGFFSLHAYMVNLSESIKWSPAASILR